MTKGCWILLEGEKKLFVRGDTQPSHNRLGFIQILMIVLRNMIHILFEIFIWGHMKNFGDIFFCLRPDINEKVIDAISNFFQIINDLHLAEKSKSSQVF